jgi:hypothetical protein
VVAAASVGGWLPGVGTTTASAAVRASGYRNRARPAPRIWKTMNIGNEVGLMPAKVSLNMRAMVTAGWVNEVEEVNQYAAPIQAATAAAESGARPVRARVKSATSPAVATSSPIHHPGAARRCWEITCSWACDQAGLGVLISGHASVGSPPATGADQRRRARMNAGLWWWCRSQLVKEPGPLDGVTPSCGA